MVVTNSLDPYIYPILSLQLEMWNGVSFPRMEMRLHSSKYLKNSQLYSMGIPSWELLKDILCSHHPRPWVNPDAQDILSGGERPVFASLPRCVGPNFYALPFLSMSQLGFTHLPPDHFILRFHYRYGWPSKGSLDSEKRSLFQ